MAKTRLYQPKIVPLPKHYTAYTEKHNRWCVEAALYESTERWGRPRCVIVSFRTKKIAETKLARINLGIDDHYEHKLLGENHE